MRSSRRRYTYSVAYLLMSAAGFAAGFWPAPSVEASLATAFPWLVYVWDSFLFWGGLMALWGSASDRWFGEYCGLPLLASVFAVYGVSAGEVWLSMGRPSAAAGTFALTGLAVFLLGRWWEVNVLRRELDRARGKGGQQ